MQLIDSTFERVDVFMVRQRRQVRRIVLTQEFAELTTG
jgi:hypothetical protein